MWHTIASQLYYVVHTRTPTLGQRHEDVCDVTDEGGAHTHSYQHTRTPTLGQSREDVCDATDEGGADNDRVRDERVGPVALLREREQELTVK